MNILPEPIFYGRIIRGSGPKRKLVHLENKGGDVWETTVKNVSKPEWIEMEDLPIGKGVSIKGRERIGVIVNVDSDHQFFPMAQSLDEHVKVSFEDGVELKIPITLEEVMAEKIDYPGVFAMDFGTSNTCFASKNRFDPTVDPAKANAPAESSTEIPSQIFFKDVSLGDQAKYTIGTDAAHDIKEYSWQTYAYFLSVKRMLGSGKDVFVLDPDAGHSPGHRQQFPIDRIAGFIIKEIISRAEDKLGAQIQRLVATYPTLYSRKRCDALMGAYKQAFELMGRDWNDERVKLVLDEANAAAFNYIYGDLLADFRAFAATSKRTPLISYDFGGGTVDVAFLDVMMTRDERGKIKVQTDLRGITGDLHFGGDNITLAAFEMLKLEVVKAIAEARHQEPEPEESAAEAAAESSPFGNLDDLFATKDDDELDAEAAAAREKEEARKAKEAAALEDTPAKDVVPPSDQEAYQEAIEAIYGQLKAITIAAQEGISLADAMKQVAESDGERVPDSAEVSQLERQIELVLPTAWSRYENVDPEKEGAAKKIFYELWHEADQMKIKLSSRGGEQRFEGLLQKIADYSTVESKVFNEGLALTYGQLERRINAAVRETVQKSYDLYRNAIDERDDGLKDEQAIILLAGNSSKLPLVKELFCEIFETSDRNLVFQADRLKTAVAQGACEAEGIQRDFGSQGLIQWEMVGSVDRLPYSIGLFSPDLIGTTQFDTGFIPIFARGTSPGEEAAVFNATHEEHFLVHDKMERLALYANYHDGTSPQYLGLFDFKGPAAPNHSADDGDFTVTLELLADRDVRLRVPSTDATFSMEPIDERVDPALNPFSGEH